MDSNHLDRSQYIFGGSKKTCVTLLKTNKIIFYYFNVVNDHKNGK